MDYSRISVVSDSVPPVRGTEDFVFYQPDFSELKDLYSVDGQPINIIDNANNVPFIQNVAQQQLIDVMPDQLDTSGISDKQLADSLIPRFAEVSDLEDVANGSLKELHKLQSESKI